MLFGSLHQLEEVSVMVLGAVDAYIIMYHNNARETVYGLVYSHLKDILWHFQTKRHMQEPVSAMMHIESGQVQRFLIYMDAPEAIPSI